MAITEHENIEKSTEYQSLAKASTEYESLNKPSTKYESLKLSTSLHDDTYVEVQDTTVFHPKIPIVQPVSVKNLGVHVGSCHMDNDKAFHNQFEVNMIVNW